MSIPPNQSLKTACAWLVLTCLVQACADDPAGANGPARESSDAGLVGGPDARALDGPDARAGDGLDAQVDGARGPLTGPTHVEHDAALASDATRWDAEAPQPRLDGQVAAAMPEGGPTADGAQPPASTTATSTLIPHPSWPCTMPQGVPPPELGTLAFSAEFEVATTRDMGQTPFGLRKVLEFGAGKISGPKLEASLMKGGFELLLTLPNGAVELEQVLMLSAKGGAPIYLRVCGLAPNTTEPVRVVMDFEAPTSSHGSLNTTKLVGVRALSPDGKKLSMRVYDVSSVAAPAAQVAIEEPSGLQEQSWECKTDKGSNGAEVYRETVAIGGSVMVGASKRGTRNVIPITGGTTTGRLKGKILPLGADFQLLGAEFVIDARYVALTDDNEIIIVRNCGALGALIPVFEARSQGPYAWINENNWLSSNPSVGLGSVSLTIYAKR